MGRNRGERGGPGRSEEGMKLGYWIYMTLEEPLGELSREEYVS